MVPPPPVMLPGKAERLWSRARRNRSDVRRRTAIAVRPERIKQVVPRSARLPVDIGPTPRIDQARGFGDIRPVPLIDASRPLHQRIKPLLVGRVAPDIEIE